MTTACTMPDSSDPLPAVHSAQPNAPIVVVLGRTAGRMSTVMDLIRDAGGLNAQGFFTEAEVMKRL
jgi:hypothetical protein